MCPKVTEFPWQDSVQSWKDPTAGVMSPAVHFIPPTEQTSKPLAGEKSNPGSCAGFGNLGGADQEGAPPGLHPQEFVLSQHPQSS